MIVYRKTDRGLADRVDRIPLASSQILRIILI